MPVLFSGGMPMTVLNMPVKMVFSPLKNKNKKSKGSMRWNITGSHNLKRPEASHVSRNIEISATHTLSCDVEVS